jgi:hypothetical protein
MLVLVVPVIREWLLAASRGAIFRAKNVQYTRGLRYSLYKVKHVAAHLTPHMASINQSESSAGSNGPISALIITPHYVNFIGCTVHILDNKICANCLSAQPYSYSFSIHHIDIESITV